MYPLLNKGRLAREPPGPLRNIKRDALAQVHRLRLAGPPNLVSCRDVTRAIGRPPRHHDEVERRGNLLLDDVRRQVHPKASHKHQTKHCLLGSSGMQRGHGPIVSRRH